MALMWIAALAHLLLLSALTAEAVTVGSNPVDNGGIIQTNLDQTVSLSCSADAAGGELQWFRDGQLVKLMEENRVDQSHLCVHPVTREDNGAIFRCQLMNNATSNDSVQLEVIYAPELSGTEEHSVEEESDLTLACDSRAHPPVIMLWHRDSQLLDLSEGRFTITNDGVTARLTMTNINRELHQGNYTCTANSEAMGERTKTFNVIVTDKTMKFPRDAMIAGIVVVVLTTLLAVLARWDRIVKCFK